MGAGAEPGLQYKEADMKKYCIMLLILSTQHEIRILIFFINYLSP
jgi:hypothetical protein